jgi:hypothetical protein
MIEELVYYLLSKYSYTTEILLTGKKTALIVLILDFYIGEEWVFIIFSTFFVKATASSYFIFPAI